MHRACATYGEDRSAFKVMMGKPESKRPLGTPTSRLEENIKMVLETLRRQTVDWLELAQERTCGGLLWTG
jgi:hypothetical protein